MIKVNERCACGAKLEITVQSTALASAPPRSQLEAAQKQLDDWNGRHRQCPGRVTEIRRVFYDPEAKGPNDQADTR